MRILIKLLPKIAVVVALQWVPMAQHVAAQGAPLTFSLQGNWDSQQRRDAATWSMTQVVDRYNSYGNFTVNNDGHIEVYYNPGVPTAQANHNSSIEFGGTWPGERVTQHESNHWLGTGTHGNWWGQFDGGDVWTGPKVAALMQQFDGDGSVLRRSGVHFYNYGLNYDNEVYNGATFMRNVALTYAMRQDMGLGWQEDPWTSRNTSSNVTLTRSDEYGTSSFNWLGGWDDNYFAHSGANYSTGNHMLRTPLDTYNPGGSTPSFTFAGSSLTVNNTNGRDGGLLFKGVGDSSILTIGNLILDGGYVRHASPEQAGSVFQLAGIINLQANPTIEASEGDIRILSRIRGSGNLNIAGSAGHSVTLANGNTFVGATVVDSGTLYADPGNGPNNKALSFTSEITVNNGATLQAGPNGLFGWDGTQERPITVNEGGTLKANGFITTDVGVGLVTLNGGELATQGSRATDFGSFRFDEPTDRLLVTADSTASAAHVKFGSADAAIDVAAGKTLLFTGSISDATAGGISYLNKAGGTGTLALSGRNNYSGGTRVSAGTLLANSRSGSATGSGNVNVEAGGVLGGNGSIGGSVVVESGGELAPGGVDSMSAVASFAVGGLELQTGSQLKLELSSSDFDQLTVDDFAALGGQLAVDLLGGFLPDSTESFTVLTAGELEGAFENVAAGGRIATLGGEGTFQVDYTSAIDQLVLSDFALVSLLPGDFDGNGYVDGADFLQWQRGEVSNPPSASDLTEWQANYDATPPSQASSTAVPEPAAALLLLIGTFGLVLRRSPRRRPSPLESHNAERARF